MISQTLHLELEENLSRGEQSILFLNRRGNSRMTAGAYLLGHPITVGIE